MAELYSRISILAFSLAGISFLFTIFFLIKFHIPALIGELSGKTAKKEIAKMRSQNENRKQNRMQMQHVRREKNSRGETGMEDKGREATAVLVEKDLQKAELNRRENGHPRIRMIQNIVLIHTDEVIE